MITSGGPLQPGAEHQDLLIPGLPPLLSGASCSLVIPFPTPILVSVDAAITEIGQFRPRHVPSCLLVGGRNVDPFGSPALVTMRCAAFLLLDPMFYYCFIILLLFFFGLYIFL